jgi:titin
MRIVLSCRPVSTVFALGGALLGLLPLVGCDGSRPVEPPLEAATANSSGLKAPSSTEATLSDSTTAQITWTDNSANEDGFRVERSPTTTGPWATAGTTSAQATSFRDGGRSSEQQICYRVIAFKRSGDSAPSNSACTTPPAAPTGLAATAVDEHTIALAWRDNSAAEDGYELQRATAGTGPFAKVATLAANAASYRDGSLTTNATYWYRVRAKRDAGFSSFSNVASAWVADAAPNAPSLWSVVQSGGTAAGVTWRGNSEFEVGFRVESSALPDGPWREAGTVLAPTPWWWAIAIWFSGLPSEQQVCYRVIAVNVVGDSPPSSTGCVTPLPTPTNLIATSIDAQTIELTWTDNSAVEDGYEVWVMMQDPMLNLVPYYAVASLPPNSTTYRYTGDDAYANYGYGVVARKDYSYSDFSAAAPPMAPQNTDGAPASLERKAPRRP